jgi:hypothetical protein
VALGEKVVKIAHFEEYWPKNTPKTALHPKLRPTSPAREPTKHSFSISLDRALVEVPFARKGHGDFHTSQLERSDGEPVLSIEGALDATSPS